MKPREWILAPVAAALAVAAFAVSAAAQQAEPPAVRSMTRRQLEAEVTAGREFITNGAVEASRPAGCVAAENRQFDFWLGEWDVSLTGQESIIAESSITLVAQGCAILEHWRPFQGGHGHSISSYDSQDHKWHQEYVGGGGRRSQMAGAFADGMMNFDILPGANAQPGPRRRMLLQQLDPNTVRQWGEIERDGAWQPTFDLTYRRRPGPQ